MQRALEVVASLASNGNADRLTINWSLLTFAHTSAIRAELMNRYSPATANKMLSALRGVLKQTWRLDLMTAEDYQRAADLPRVGQKMLLWELVHGLANSTVRNWSARTRNR